MIDVQLLRSELDAVAARLATRGYSLDRKAFLDLETRRKEIQQQVEGAQAERNRIAREI